LKEAEESSYWLELLKESGYIDEEKFNSLYSDCEEVIRILVKILKNIK
jgi:four helix bundle protein